MKHDSFLFPQPERTKYKRHRARYIFCRALFFSSGEVYFLLRLYRNIKHLAPKLL